MTFFLIQPCRSTAAFEAIPRKAIKLDLMSLERVLEQRGFTIEANAGAVLAVSRDGHDISIYPSGKLLIKVPNQATAEQILEELEPLLQI